MRIQHALRISISLIVASFVLVISSCAVTPDSTNEQYNPQGRPLSPTGLKATNGYEDTISLTWDSVEGADTYSVWRIPSTQYGGISAESIVDGDNVYSWLASKQFTHLGQTTSTSYTDSSSQSESFVYTVVAIKENDSKSGSLLYSKPSAYAEGSSLDSSESINIDAIGTDSIINIFWAIPNMYSVLSDSQEVLYDDYSFTVRYKKTTETEWKTAEEGLKATSYTIDNALLALDLDTDYNVMIEGKIYEGDSVINTPTSPIYTVRTDSTLAPAPMKSVTASQGTLSNGVEITWEYPDIPESIQGLYQNGYQIERLSDNRQWIPVLEVGDCTPGAESWTDTSAENNKEYRYRVRFAYISQDGGASIMQPDTAVITEASTTGWKTWTPTDITVKAGDVTGTAPELSREINISWTYDVPEEDNSSWKILINDWSQSTGKVSTTEEEVAESDQHSFTISVNDDVYHYFTFELVHIVNSEEFVFDVSGDEDEAINFNRDDKDIKLTSFTATDDLVGIVRLTWTMEDEAAFRSVDTVSISEDNGDYVPITGYINEGNGTYYYDYVVDDEAFHSYRISINDVHYSEVAGGRVLKAPSVIAATDGEYKNKIVISFDYSDYDNDIKYKVTAVNEEDKEEYVFDSYPAGGLSIEIADDTSDGTIRDVSMAGTVYDITVSVANKNQENVWSAHSASDKGNILGGAAMNVTAGMYENPEEFTFSWENQATGATNYYVYIWRGEQWERLSGSPEASVSEYSVPYRTAIQPGTEGYALSGTYEFKIVPRRGSTLEANLDSVPSVTGALFCPPANVKASKGISSDSITIEWSPVEKASSYNIYRTPSDSSGDIDSYEHIVNVVGESYEDRSANNGEYAYVVTSVMSDGTESLKQDPASSEYPFPMEVNMYNEEEKSNVGYLLMAPSQLAVYSVTDQDGKYADYVRVEWIRSKGATSYVLSNSIFEDDRYNSDLIIDVSEIDYSVDNPNNGVEGKGYLSYDKENGRYTYYDGRGVMKESALIFNYSVQGMHDNSISSAAANSNLVTRQLNAYEWINLVNVELQEHLGLANSQFYGDWFPPAEPYVSSTQYKYDSDNENIEIYSATGGGSNTTVKTDNAPYIKLSDYVSTVFDGFHLTTSPEKLMLAPNSSGNYWGDNYLSVIGANDYSSENSVVITPDDDGYYGVTVEYVNVNLRENKGSYIVTIDEFEPIPIENTSENRPYLVAPFEG